MSEAYEIQDSYLVDIEQQGARLILRIDANKQIWPEGFGHGIGTGWTQPIELVLEEATLSSEFASFPVELVDGHFHASEIHAKPEDIVQGLIPASLTASGPVEILLEGMEEDSDEIKSATLRARSATIAWHGEAEFQENLGEDL